MPRINYRALMSITYCLVSLVFLFFGQFTAGLLFALLGYLVLMQFLIRNVGWNSVFFFFLILFGLYGYSVPISVFFNLDIGWHRVAKLSTWEKVDATLFSFLISNQLAFLSIAIVAALFINKKYIKEGYPDRAGLKLTYFELSLLAGVMASLGELVNFIRVGGFYATSQGKAFYQGAVNDLVLNVPYEGFLYISVALFSMFFANAGAYERWVRYFLPYAMSVAFVLGINLLIGERGTLVVFGAIFFLGYYMNRRITRFKPRVVVLLSLIYVGFNILTLLREPTIRYEGLAEFWNKYNQKIVWVMNPANTEFAASALNYRIFIDRKEEPYTYKLGATYLEFVWAFVPTYVYSNKPQGIIYDYRDAYFPERRNLGSTAGTGFSSYIEAYMNFWYFGPFLIYLLTAGILVYLENKREQMGLFTGLLYLLSFNIVLIFSRSASQYILSTAISYVFQIIALIVIYQVMPKTYFQIVINGKK